MKAPCRVLAVVGTAAVCCPGASAFAFAPTASLGRTAAQRGASGRVVMMADRLPIVAGNWKENPGTIDEALSLSSAVAEATKKSSDVEVAVFPPFPFIYSVMENMEGSGCKVGAQNCYFEENGAFTGAVSNSMLESMGCDYVLCGHSERRALFRNDDNAIQRKVRAVLDHNMPPILCIGESKGEYEAGLVESICAMQLAKDLKGVSKEEMKKVVVAYEPVWAIGTGLAATPEIAQSVHAFIRSYIAKLFDEEVAGAVRIQYGGSVTPDSIKDIMAQPDVDGVLVGGASLAGDKFTPIINYK